jgi:hypothetical protein
MAKNEENKKSQKPAGADNKVVSIVVDRCKAEGCKAKSTRAGFCEEHYHWFKEGLITSEGQPAKDFDKKYQIFLRTKKRAA